MTTKVERDLYDVMVLGSLGTVGEVTLAVAPATSTTVTNRSCSTNSFVGLMATNAAAATEGIGLRIVPTQGQFVIHHSSSAGSREYRYHIHTPRRPL